MSRKLANRNRRIKKAEFETYASFLALPWDERREVFGFHTDLEFAKKYNLHPGTLTAWKEDDKLWEIRDRYLKEFKKYTANVLKSLYAGIIEKKSASEVLAWFKIVEGREGLEEKTSSQIFINLIKNAFIQLDRRNNTNSLKEPEGSELVLPEHLEEKPLEETEGNTGSSPDTQGNSG